MDTQQQQKQNQLLLLRSRKRNDICKLPKGELSFSLPTSREINLTVSDYIEAYNEISFQPTMQFS